MSLTKMKFVTCLILTWVTAIHAQAASPLISYVNTFLGTAPITNVTDIGFVPPPDMRVWAGLTFPGASMPNAMVQLSPITKWHSGAGYEYENEVIYAFTHSNKGHWNLCHIPFLPVTGSVNPDDFGSRFDHKNEAASPGYYQVLLQRYGINAELTSTLRCGFHKYTFPQGQNKKLIVNMPVSNERVTDWNIEQKDDNSFTGYQDTRGKVFFYALANHKITKVETLEGRTGSKLPVVSFAPDDQPLEIRVGLSFTSAENAKLNLEKELAGRSFSEVRAEATKTWEKLLSNIEVTGGSERQKGLFYSSLYRSFLWPALRSDVNGEFMDESGKIVKKDFNYYTIPSLWDDYRNKLVLLGMISPKVAEDVIQSMIDRGEVTGFMPTFFHGDHAAPFIAGTYLRGIKGFDVKKAYELLLNNANSDRRRGGRPYGAEFRTRGYVSEREIEKPHVETKSTAGVTKTLEYAYDDYSIALLAKELKDQKTYEEMMGRSYNYTNLFDPSTGLMRGRLANGSWVEPFDPQYPYYEYMYREANAWQSSFFAPHDTKGLIGLFPSKQAFEAQLDRLFTIPWNPKHIAWNINSFIGQYCHGNQPDHGFPYLYYWVGKQEKTQKLLNEIMERFYGMDSGLTLCGMDDAGEMSAWYVFNAIGLYTYSPADPEYIVTVPIFDEVRMKLAGNTVTIFKATSGLKINEITYNGRKVEGYFISHQDLVKGGKLVVK